MTQVHTSDWRVDISQVWKDQASLLMEMQPEAASPSIKHWKHKPRETTELILSHRKAWGMCGAIPAGQLKSQPSVSLNFPHNSHTPRDVTCLEKNHRLQQPLTSFHSVESLIPPCEQECAAFLSVLAPGILPIFLHTATLSTGRIRRHLWALGK